MHDDDNEMKNDDGGGGGGALGMEALRGKKFRHEAQELCRDT